MIIKNKIEKDIKEVNNLKNIVICLSEYKNIISFYTLYCCFLVFITCLYVQRMFYMESIGVRMIRIITVSIYVGIFPFFASVLILVPQRRCRQLLQKDYYVPTQVRYNLQWRIQNVNYIKKGIHWGCAWVAISVIIFGCLNYWENIENVVIRIDSLIWKDSTNSFSMVGGIYTIIFAIFPVGVSFVKKKCKFLNAYEIPYTNVCLKTSIASIVVLVVIIVSKLLDKHGCFVLIMEMLWIVLVLGDIFSFIFALSLPLINEKNAFKKFEKIYISRNSNVFPKLQWDKMMIINEMNKMFEIYKRNSRKINLGKAMIIEFDSLHSTKEENYKIAQLSYFKLLLITLFFELFWALVVKVETGSSYMICLSFAMVGGIPSILPILNKNIWEKNYRIIAELGNMSAWGYYVSMGRITHFFTQDSIWPSKYREFVMSLKRIGCFYDTANYMIYKDNEYSEEVGINLLCGWFEDEYRQMGKTNSLLLAPILVCCCLSEKNNEIIENRIKHLLKDTIVSKDEKEWIRNICLIILRDIEGNDVKYNSHHYNEKIDGLWNTK